MIRVAIMAETLSRAQGLASLLSEDQRLEIVEARAAGASFDGDEASMIDVLVAVRLPAGEIPAGGPPVVLLSDGPADEGLFGRQVRAWLPLEAPAAEVAAAIAAAASDLWTLTRDQARQWLRSAASQNDQEVYVEPLTPRELQVLRMLADGLGNKEIGGQLGISEHTAKFHVAQILAKLGAGSRTEAVRIGIRRGLVPI